MQKFISIIFTTLAILVGFGKAYGQTVITNSGIVDVTVTVGSPTNIFRGNTTAGLIKVGTQSISLDPYTMSAGSRYYRLSGLPTRVPIGYTTSTQIMLSSAGAAIVWNASVTAIGDPIPPPPTPHVNQFPPTITSGHSMQAGTVYQATANVGGPNPVGSFPTMPPPNMRWRLVSGPSGSAIDQTSGALTSPNPGTVQIQVMNLGDNKDYYDSPWSGSFDVTVLPNDPSGALRVVTLDPDVSTRTRIDAPFRLYVTATTVNGISYSLRRTAVSTVTNEPVSSGPERLWAGSGAGWTYPLNVAGAHNEIIQLIASSGWWADRVVAEVQVQVLPLPAVTVQNVPPCVNTTRVSQVIINASNLYPGHTTYARVTDSSGKQWFSKPVVGNPNGQFTVPIENLLDTFNKSGNILRIELISENNVAGWSAAVSSGGASGKGSEQLLSPVPTFTVNVSDSLNIIINTL